LVKNYGHLAGVRGFGIMEAQAEVFYSISIITRMHGFIRNVGALRVRAPHCGVDTELTSTLQC